MDGHTISQTYDVFIKDPCSTSTFEIDPHPLIDMGFTMYYATTETQTQPVKIWTDVERMYGIVCPIKATITGDGVDQYLFLNGALDEILLDGQFASDLDVGLHTITLTVDNEIFDTQVPQQTYTFIVDL